MAGLIFLGIGLLCAVIGRIMLMVAAFGVSIWWGLGVFLPFGPVFFRLSYPDLANPSRWFRLASLPCLFMYFTLSPSLAQTAYYRHKIKRTPPPSQIFGYATEGSTQKTGAEKSTGQTDVPQVPLGERMRINAAEFERLHKWQDALRIRKRDLLNSDAAGSRAYAIELARYNEALQKAQTEHDSIAAGH